MTDEAMASAPAGRVSDEGLRALFEMWRLMPGLWESDPEIAAKVQAMLDDAPGFAAQVDLILSAKANDLEAVRDALAEGADPNWMTHYDRDVRRHNGCTAMVLAMDLEVLAALKAAGGDVNQKTHRSTLLRDTLWTAAYVQRDVVHHSRTGGDAAQVDELAAGVECQMRKAEWLMREGADLTQTGAPFGGTVLAWVMFGGNLSLKDDAPMMMRMVRMLMAHGAELSEKEKGWCLKRLDEPEYAALKTAYEEGLAARAAA